MDDDRLARAREGDLYAFLVLVRPRAGRLMRLAALGSGEPVAARRAALAAIRSAWRDVRRLRAAADLDLVLERALAASLPRGHAGTDPPDPLGRALRGIRPADRLALARCLDAQPDRRALAVAGRLGIEATATAPHGAASGSADGEIVDLDGPLAGWDLASLRAALGAAARAVAPDADVVLEAARADLAAVRPDGGVVAALRTALPGSAALVRGAALGLTAVLGVGVLLAAPSVPGAPAGGVVPAAPATPAGGVPVGAGDDGTGTLRTADALDDAPASVDGLPVLDVVAARRLVDDPAAAGRTIAIRGWLAQPQLAGPCLAPLPATRGPGAGPGADETAPVAVASSLDVAAAFCLRDTVLRAEPGSDWRGPHLHPQLLPGTGLGRARRVFAAMDGRSVPVVVLAHFGDPRAAPCAPGSRHCGEELVIERIAWVSGASARPPIAVRPLVPGTVTRRSGQDAIEIVEATFGGLRAISVTGLPTAELDVIEPAAAAAGPPARFGWLVRALVEPRPGEQVGARRTWLLVDDRTGEVVAAPDIASSDGGGTGFLFPRAVDGALVRTPAEVAALVRAGLPEGTALAVSGWLGTPSLAGACLAETGRVTGPLADGAAFCRRSVLLRGPAPGGRALALQLPPGAPALPVEEAVAARSMPVPVVALVVAGSSRAEPCLPGRGACSRPLALERLLWVDGTLPGVPVAMLDAPGTPAPRLTTDDVRDLASVAAGERPLLSIVRVPAARRAEIVPGAAGIPVAGEHAWIVLLRSPLESPTVGRGARLELAWWLLVDDATGRTTIGGAAADLPDLPPPATPPG